MGILEWIILICVLLWIAGLGFHIGGGLVHILIVVAVVILIIRLVQRRPLL
jgi:hypothetical protein